MITGVVDRDTLEIRGRISIRLGTVYASEANSEASQRATQKLRELIEKESSFKPVN